MTTLSIKQDLDFLTPQTKLLLLLCREDRKKESGSLCGSVEEIRLYISQPLSCSSSTAAECIKTNCCRGCLSFSAYADPYLIFCPNILHYKTTCPVILKLSLQTLTLLGICLFRIFTIQYS